MGDARHIETFRKFEKTKFENMKWDHIFWIICIIGSIITCNIVDCGYNVPIADFIEKKVITKIKYFSIISKHSLTIFNTRSVDPTDFGQEQQNNKS